MKFCTSNKLSCVAAADFLNILQVICPSNLKPFFNSSVLFIGIKYIVSAMDVTAHVRTKYQVIVVLI